MRTPDEERLLALLKERAYQEGEVVLASGQVSDFYIDGRMVAVCPEGAHLIGETLYERTKELEFDAVGGLAVGAVPLVASFVIACHRHGREVEGFWVRPETKSHGTRKKIEGKFPPAARTLIVEDVATSGGSALKAIEQVEAAGGSVVAVATLVDREAGAAVLLAQRGYDYRPLFSKRDFV